MSSTNRSNARDSHKSDYYVTPLKPIYELFEKMNFINPDFKFLDPCAGGDSENEMSYPTVIKELYPNCEIKTLDIREDSLAEEKIDYLKSDMKDKYDVIITNPPFNIAREIITKSLYDVKEGGYVIMLLRLNFFGSKERRSFWIDNMPITTYIHTKRISFTKGSTDSIEYCHMIWKKDVSQNHTTAILI